MGEHVRRRKAANEAKAQPTSTWQDRHVVYEDSRGTLWHRSTGSVIAFRAVGHMSRAMARQLIAKSASHIESHSDSWSFNDWEDLDTYDLDARLELTSWLLRNRTRFVQAHILTHNRLINSGVSLAQVMLGDTLQAHQDRGTYEAALAEACGANQRPHHRHSTRSVDLDEGALVDGRYRVLKRLGRGTSGTVHLAEDVQLERLTALKFIDHINSSEAHSLALAEARALASVRHDNIVAVYATGTHEHTPYVAMEFVKGTSFSEIIWTHRQRSGWLPLVPALSMLARVARGLSAVHSAGLVHRDVKPGNVVVERVAGRPVLVDFGLAEAPMVGPDPTHIAGTPAFMAPELCGFDRAPPSPQSDFYAWGVMAFELLTGSLPFDDTDLLDVIEDHMFTDPPLPSSHRSDLNPIDDLLLRTLAKNPENRPATGSEIALHLESVVARLVGRPERRLERVRALIVTGEPIAEAAAEAVRRAFKRLPLEIVIAADGRRALEAAQSVAPDIVLVGGLLPDMHGLEFLLRLRAQGLGPTQEFVLQPGSTDDEWRFRALGIHRFIEHEDPAAIAAALIETGQHTDW